MESKEKTDQNKIIEYKSEFNIINSSTSLNNPSEFLFAQNPLTDLNESDSAIIHIKNTCKNSYCNCYVNCCFGHSVIYDTFVKTTKSTKYLFQNVASILPDYFTCYFKDNIELLANFKSFIKSTPDEIQTDKGNLFAEMVKNDVFSFCNRKEQILMPVRIPSENRMPGIVKLIYNKEKCLCPFFPCYQCDSCCPNCSDCSCGSCGSGGSCCTCDPNCCRSDPSRCCCGICPRPICCREDRCCCGLCPKPKCDLCSSKSCCCCCGCGECGCSSFKCSGNCSCTFPLFQCFPYCAEILDFNGQLKYYVFLENKCSYFSKCLKRRAGLDFNICDVNKNPICTISGRNNKDFGAFFEDSYSYEINFPPDADADIKLILLNCVFALDALCVY